MSDAFIRHFVYLQILLIALISTVGAQEDAQRSARTPQAQIRYQDPNGEYIINLLKYFK